jgi:hypothetical protein
MPIPYSSEDLSRVFDGRVLTRGRTLVLLGAVQVSLEGAVIRAVVEDNGQHHAASVTPRSAGRRVSFAFDCSCKHSGCAHLAAASLAAFDRYPALRRAEQTNFFDRMAADAVVPERQRLAIGLAAGSPLHGLRRLVFARGGAERPPGAGKSAQGHVGRDEERGGEGACPIARRRRRNAHWRAGCSGAGGAQPAGTNTRGEVAGHRKTDNLWKRALV